MPKVSVIIPVYNTEKYLTRCLESVCSQTLADIEIICINDCSTDNSLQILQEYAGKDKRIKLIEFTENKGAASARNAGIDVATGEYLAFLDSDDYPEFSDFYEKLYLRAVETGADIVKGAYKNSNDGLIDETINAKIKENKNNFCSTYCSAIFRTKLIKDNNIKFPLTRDMEDPVFAFRCGLKANAVEVVDNLNLIITKREDSATAQLADFNQVKEKISNLEIISSLGEQHKIIYPVVYWFITVFLDSLRNNGNSDIEEYLTYQLYFIYKKFKSNSEFISKLRQISFEVEDYFSNLNDDSVYYFDKERLKDLIDKAEVVSFDIFDTLLLRPFINPIDVFLYIEQKFNSKGFYSERIKAEKRARVIKKFRNKNSEDIFYEDIYKTIKPEYKYLEQIELDIEKQTLQKNNELLEIFDYAKSKNKKIIITSDMYLHSDFLASVLEEKGFKGFSKIYVSSEIDKCKCSGQLYEYIINDLKVTPDNILQVGDNIISDVEKAKEKGLNAFYYKMVKMRFFNLFSHRSAFNFYNEHNSASEIIMLHILHWHNNRKPASYWEQLGYNYGGFLLATFISEINKVVKARSLTDLFCVARDGYLIKKLYYLLYPDSDVKVHYIYASRKIKQLCTKSNELYSENTNKEYLNYAKSIETSGKNIGIVDTCAGVFSAQDLIEEFWPDVNFVGIYIACYLTYKYNYINLSTTVHCDKNAGFNWDFIESLLSSPEPPIEDFKDYKPVYRTALEADDIFYMEIFPELEKGMMDFILDMKNIADKSFECYSIPDVFSYIKEFWNNMTSLDKIMLSKIKHPANIEQTQYVPLLGRL